MQSWVHKTKWSSRFHDMSPLSPFQLYIIHGLSSLDILFVLWWQVRYQWRKRVSKELKVGGVCVSSLVSFHMPTSFPPPLLLFFLHSWKGNRYFSSLLTFSALCFSHLFCPLRVMSHCCLIFVYCFMNADQFPPAPPTPTLYESTVNLPMSPLQPLLKLIRRHML